METTEVKSEIALLGGAVGVDHHFGVSQLFCLPTTWLIYIKDSFLQNKYASALTL